MMVLRCTQKLLTRLGRAGEAPLPESTTHLGDWYGTILRLGRTQYLMFISQHSRLAAVLPARDSRRMLQLLPEVICELLMEIGIPTSRIQDERERMSTVAFGRTQSRSLLGTLNDYSAMARYGYQHRGVPESPEELMRFLAQTPILPLKGASPIELTRAAFGLPHSVGAVSGRGHGSGPVVH